MSNQRITELELERLGFTSAGISGCVFIHNNGKLYVETDCIDFYAHINYDNYQDIEYIYQLENLIHQTNGKTK
jgi:hypothetical protein